MSIESGRRIGAVGDESWRGSNAADDTNARSRDTRQHRDGDRVWDREDDDAAESRRTADDLQNAQCRGETTTIGSYK